MNKTLLVTLLVVAIVVLSILAAVWLFPPPEPVPRDSFQVTMHDLPSNPASVQKQYILEAGAAGLFFSFGVGRPETGVSGFGFTELRDQTRLSVEVAESARKDGKLWSVQVLFEARSSNIHSSTGPTEYTVAGKATVYDAVSFGPPTTTLHKIGQTIVLGTVDGREITLTVIERDQVGKFSPNK
jgi:hypothetical protein